MSSFTSYIQIARPGHWFKNIFLIPGIVVAKMLTGLPLDITHIILGFGAVCLIASANYVLNEYLDAKFDKYHPKKKDRPCATNQISTFSVFVEYAFLFLLGVLLGLKISIPFTIALISLFVAGIFYNVKPFRTKDKVYLDVLSESINNPIRLLIGWYMVTSSSFPPASLLMGYWMAGAFLMAVKRFAEYRFIGDPVIAGQYRQSFKYYTEENLLISILFYASASSFFLGVFLIKYKPELILSFFSLAILFAWYFHLSFKKDSPAQHPEKLFKEKRFVLYFILVIILLFVTSVMNIPQIKFMLDTPFLRSTP